MKARVYLRVARGKRGPKFAATTKPSYAPLRAGAHWETPPLPTVAFAIDLTIPDAAFEQAAHVLAELEIPAERVEVAADVSEDA